MRGKRDNGEANLNEHIRSLGFWDVRGGVTLERVTLWRLECIWQGLWLRKDNNHNNNNIIIIII